MTEYLLSIDPGLSTGLALLSYDETSAPVLEKAWQFGGGVAGLSGWAGEHWDGDYWNHYNDEPNTRGFYGWKMGVSGVLSVDESWGYVELEEVEIAANTTVITEKFTARATKGFSYRTDALEPLRCEGALIALGIMPDYDVKDKRWLDPGLQYVVGGKDKADKKKRQHRFLKDSGYYCTGKDFGTADADDVRSSVAHGIGYLARVKKHRPSYELIANWIEDNPA